MAIHRPKDCVWRGSFVLSLIGSIIHLNGCAQGRYVNRVQITAGLETVVGEVVPPPKSLSRGVITLRYECQGDSNCPDLSLIPSQKRENRSVK